MAIEYNFTLDMDRSKRDNNIVYARTGDMDSITINADLVFGGAAYTPSGTNAFFECITPNGRSVRASAEKTGSSVSVEVPSAAFQAAGVINVAYFRFESGASDNPTYVESTEPFAIVVREGIGDNIDAGDYIEEWRKLADQLEAAVAEVEKKAEQAETAIDEQKTEVDQLKAQAQKAIAGDVTEVEGVAQSAIAAINKEKADVADAAEDISAAGEQAINSFNSKSTSAINKFNIDGTSAINQFNTNAGSKLDEVDGMITEAQGDVDAAITQLEDKTQDAIDAAQDALDGTIATNLQNAINRTLKLDVADMMNIPDNSSLSSFTNVGSYCCKTAATAATVGDCPIDDSPFNMYVFSSATSGQVMQLVVPIDLNGKPTAEWHVRFGTSSAMDKWSVIGGGADIAAGLGIDVTGDAKKTVSLDTEAFYQHHEAASIIQGSSKVTGGGRIKELKVYGNTRQNLWTNPSVTKTQNGITVTPNSDGSITVSGTSTSSDLIMFANSYALQPGSQYTFSVDNLFPMNEGESIGGFFIQRCIANQTNVTIGYLSSNSKKEIAVNVPSDAEYCVFGLQLVAGAQVSGTYRVMLNEGSEAQPWCPPGLNGVDELSVVMTGKNLLTTNFAEIQYKNNSGTFYGQADMDAPVALSGQTVAVSVYIDGKDATGIGGWALYIGGFSSSVTTTNVLTLNEEKRFGIVGDVLDGTIIRFFANPDFNDSTECIISVQLELGHTATSYEPPAVTATTIDLSGHTLNSLPDGTRDELRIDSTGAVTMVQRVAVVDYSGDSLNIAGSDVAVTPEFIDKVLQTGDYAGFVDFSPKRQASDFATIDNVDFAPGYPLVGIYTQNDGTRLRIGTGKASADGIAQLSELKSMLGSVTWHHLYSLAAPQEVDLHGVTLPELASPDYTIFASSNVSVEIEADVVKVDYLPAPDVYTKEEVDRKIEDAGMPAVVPVSKGGTGVTTAAAERNRLGLGNTTGALPVANGGTGKTTVKAAQNALLANINTVSTDVGDDSFFVGYYQSPSDATGALYKRVSSDIWNWIVSKIRSTFGFSSINVLPVANGGTGSTSAKAAQNSLLNDMNESSDVLTDSSMLVGYNASPSASNGAVHKRSVSTVWDYIASKVADKVWDQIKTKAVCSDTATGTDLTLVGGLESMSHVSTSTLMLGINEMSLDNSNAVPFTVNGEEVITEGNISSHLPATFDAKSVWFSTPLKQGQQKNIITEGAFTLDELRKYFVPGNLVLANFICGGEHDAQLDQVVPMFITTGEGIAMQPSGTTYNYITNTHYNCIFAVANNEQAGGGGGSGIADGVTMLYSVTEVPGFVDRTSTSSLKGFTVFDLVSHAI